MSESERKLNWLAELAIKGDGQGHFHITINGDGSLRGTEPELIRFHKLLHQAQPAYASTR